MKVCSKCGQEKQKNEFYKDKRTLDGLYSDCKQCHDNITKKYSKKYRKNPKGKAVIRANDRKYRQTKKYKLRIKKYRQSPQYKLRVKKYLLTPIARLIWIKAHAKQRNIYFNLSLSEYLKIWGNPCFYCGEPLKYTSLDRINNKLGYTPGNVVACCRLCNRRKFKSTQEEYLKRIGRL